MGADVPEDVPQSENVDETRRSKKTSPYVCTVTEAQGPECPWCVSRASYMLEMIQQKSHASQE